MANVYHKPGRITGEVKDCSVIAFSYAFNIDYSVAYAKCKKAGRKDNEGFHLDNLFKLGPWAGRFNKTTRQVWPWPYKKNRQYLGRTVTWHDKPKQTVATFQKKHPTGIFIVHVRGHVFTVIDGVVFNQSRMGMRVENYYYIGRPPVTG